MKTFLFALASILFLQSVTARSVALDDTKKTCEDYLKADTCAQLRSVAKIFHENVQVVNDAVVEAYKKHKENAQDMIKYVREYMVQRATNFKCEDVLSADQCTTLATQAAKFKVNSAELLEDIKEAVAKGQMHGKALYQKSVEIMLTKLEQARNLTCEQLIDDDTCKLIKDWAKDLHMNYDKYMKAAIDAYSKGFTSAKDFLADVKDYMMNEGSCDDVLGAQRCDQLRAIATTFKENAQIVNQAVVAAYFQNKKTVVDTMNFVRGYLVQKATNFKCEDVLTSDQCLILKEQAAKFKVSSAELLEDIKDAVARGQMHGKALYEKSVEIMLMKLEQAKNLTCEQLIDADTCAQVKLWAKNLGLKGDEYMQAAIDAYSKGLVHAKDFLADAKQYLKNEISCERVLGETNCNYLRTIAGPKFNKVIDFLKEKYAEGMSQAKDLYKAAKTWLWNNWNIFSDEQEMEDFMLAMEKF